jgi:hypothetical protein
MDEPRQRFRFRIAEILWAMLVLGMALGWWLDHSSLARESTQLRLEHARSRSLLTRFLSK